MKWFRLYSSVLNDPKVQRLSPVLFKHWINILCVASENDPRGELPCVTDLAFALRLKPTQMRKVLESLRQAGVIEASSDGKVLVHNWTERQRESDNVAARVEKHRSRKNADSDSGAIRNVTLHETLPKRSVDTDTEEETDTETFPLSGDVDLKEREHAEGAPPKRTRSPSHRSKRQSPDPIPLPVRPQPRPVNPIWDTLCEVFYQPTTKVERSNFGKIVRELTEVGATPDDIRQRMRQHQKAQNHWDMTPNALVTHWSELGNHNGKAAATHGLEQQQPGTNRQNGIYDPEQDPILMERRAAARLVRQLGQQQTS